MPHAQAADFDAGAYHRGEGEQKVNGRDHDPTEGLGDAYAEQEGQPTDARFAEVEAEIVDWPKLAGRSPPPRRFVWPDWTPWRAVTLLHGFGGVGKTLLAQQLGTAAAFKREMLGSVVAASPVLGWFGEDDADEIWRRQVDINAALGIGGLDELEGKVYWRACPHDDITLFAGSSESSYQSTDNFEILRRLIRKTGAEFVILDSAAQIAAIPEINRPLVTRCLQMLTSLCHEFDATVLLLGHNNRDGDFSGTSAWENRCRSRVHMKRKKAEDGTETISLCRPRANYAALESGVAIEWRHGAYYCTDQRFETGAERLERELKEGAIDRAFLDALDALTAQHRGVSHSKQASTYAPKVMTETGQVDGCTKEQLQKAMQRLFKAERIVASAPLPWQTSDRHSAVGLARKGA